MLCNLPQEEILHISLTWCFNSSKNIVTFHWSIKNTKEPNWRSFIDKNWIQNIHTAVLSWFLILFVEKRCLEVVKIIMTMSATINFLWPAVWISDVLNKTGMLKCGKKISNTSWACLFLLFIGKEQTSMAVPQVLIWSPKVLSLYKYW